MGGNDHIESGPGSDVVLGGQASDTVLSGSGNDVILGDNAVVDFVSTGHYTFARTTDPGVGGLDTIYAGEGDDVVFGGTDADTIYGELGTDHLLGDNGYVDYLEGTDQNPDTLDLIISTNPHVGGNDAIDAGGDNDYVFGGTGAQIQFRVATDTISCWATMDCVTHT